MVRARLRRLERRLRHAHARHGARLPARDRPRRRPASAAASTCAHYLHRGLVDADRLLDRLVARRLPRAGIVARCTCTARASRSRLMHPLIYDWNKTDAPRPPVVMLDDETLRDGLQSPSVRCPIDRREAAHPAPDRSAGHRYRRHRPARRRPARRPRRRAAGPGDCRSAPVGARPTAPRARSMADIRPIAEISQRVGHADRSAARSSARARCGSTRKGGRSTSSSS